MGNILLGHARGSGYEQEGQVSISGWYAGWHTIFRAMDPIVASKIADCAIKACQNDVIGYSQPDRYSMYNQIADKGFDPSTATQYCHTDCSQLVATCCAYAGVPIDKYNTTRSETANLRGTGKFQVITAGANDPNSYQRGDILLKSGHTAVVVSTNGQIQLGAISGMSFTYTFNKYSLSPSEITKIARLCKQEQGSLIGAKAEASLAANILETNPVYRSRYGNDIYNFMRTSRWFYKAAYYMDRGDASNEIVEGVRDVLVNGNRVLPLFVDEHDGLGDIVSVTNNGQEISKLDRASYVQDTTIIKNRMSSTYKFWCFPDSNSDPFGYTNEALRMTWNQYLNTGSNMNQYGYGSAISIDWTKLKPYIMFVDRYTTRKLNYTDLMSNCGVIGVMIEGGKGTQLQGFRNPKCYDQAREAMAAKCPFGYVIKSVATNTKQANDEMECVRYLVSHYSPQLGVWIELGDRVGKSTNDKIMRIYERELVKFGLKNKIGIRCTKDYLQKNITWLNFQENWYLWLVEPVGNVTEVNQLLDPTFFDTDNASGPIRGANGGFFTTGATNTSSVTGAVSSGNTQARDMFELGDRAYNEANPNSAACQEWIEKVAAMVRIANQKWHVKTSFIIATVIAESGWMHTPSGYNGDGHTLSENNNVMGINDYPELTSTESNWYTYRTSDMFNVSQWDSAGNKYYHPERMKTYRSVEDCIEDFIAFMCKMHPEFKGNNNLDAYGNFLAHYTPNPHEPTINSRRRIIQSYNLERFDT